MKTGVSVAVSDQVLTGGDQKIGPLQYTLIF